MTFSLAFPFPSSSPSIPALLPGRLRPSTAEVAPELLGFGEDGLSAGLRWRTVGVGKLLRLSTASTVRWKRRKRVWARRRVEGRSIVFESSLTIKCNIRFLPNLKQPGNRGTVHTVFQNFIKVLQMLHYDFPMFLQYCQCNKEMEVTTHIVRP